VGEEISGAGPGGLSSKFTCGTSEIETEGSVIGEVSPVGVKASATGKLTFVESAKETQQFEEIEGTKGVYLKTEIGGLGAGSFPFKSTEATVATIKGPALEVKP
jgi:hypothetical protein